MASSTAIENTPRFRPVTSGTSEAVQVLPASAEWKTREAIFYVDGRQVLQAVNPPTRPLGFVAWVDNNATTMGPGKDFDFKRIAVPQRQWMELSYVRIEVS